MDWRWFNWGAPMWRIRGKRVRLWNLFNEVVLDKNDEPFRHWWGIGLLQINRRHLLFVGYCGVRVLFVGQTP